MDDTLYDEFGNYIGPDLGSSGDDSDEDEGVSAVALLAALVAAIACPGASH